MLVSLLFTTNLSISPGIWLGPFLGIVQVKMSKPVGREMLCFLLKLNVMFGRNAASLEWYSCGRTRFVRWGNIAGFNSGNT